MYFIYLVGRKRSVLYRVEVSNSRHTDMLQKLLLLWLVYACAKMRCFSHHNHFTVLLESQDVETNLLAGVRLTLNNYGLRS